MRIAVVTTSYPAYDGDPSGHFVETEVAELRGASMIMRQAVRRGEAVLATAEVTVVGVRDGKPARLPPQLRAALAGAGS